MLEYVRIAYEQRKFHITRRIITIIIVSSLHWICVSI